MPRCLDQKTEFAGLSDGFPSMLTELVMREGEVINTYDIDTRTTTYHPKTQLTGEEHGVEHQRHYDTTIRLNGIVKAVDHLELIPDYELARKDAILAFINHIQRVNQIREEGGQKVIDRIYVPSKK